MATENKEFIEVLNDIYQFLNDSYLCFEKYIGNVNDQELKKLFSKICFSRKTMIDQIKNALSEYAYEPEFKASLIGKTHLLFENIKAFMMKGDPLGIIKEVRRGEGVLIELYKNALVLNVDLKTRQMLLDHISKISEVIKIAALMAVT